MVSQLLFTAFSNRADAVQLAQEAGRQLHDEGVTTRLHLLDVDATPDVDASTLVVSLGGDGTFLKSARSPMRWARGCSRSTWADWGSS